jgi:hypothetical protein
MKAPVSRSAVPDKHQYVKRAARKPLRRSCKKSGSEGAIVVERVRSHSAAITTSTMASMRRPSRTRISGPGRGNRLCQVIRAAFAECIFDGFPCAHDRSHDLRDQEELDS